MLGGEVCMLLDDSRVQATNLNTLSQINVETLERVPTLCLVNM